MRTVNMKIFKIFNCLLIALICFTICDARGGRGGGNGRGGGHSSGRGWGSSRRGSTSSISSSSSSHSARGSGWVQGFFHSTPQYSYRPIFIPRSSGGGGHSHYTPQEEYSSSNDDSYAIGYTISRGLSGDFFSLFNMVRGISKYPDKIRNNEIIETTTTTTTTTEVPVGTYDYPSSNFNYNYKDINAMYEEIFKNLNLLEEDINNFSFTENSTPPTSTFTNEN